MCIWNYEYGGDTQTYCICFKAQYSYEIVQAIIISVFMITDLTIADAIQNHTYYIWIQDTGKAKITSIQGDS